MPLAYALLLTAVAAAARVKQYTPPGARAFISRGNSSAPITNPEEWVNTLGGTKAIGGQEDSFGNVLPEVTFPWGFNGWAPTTTLGNGGWFFQSEDRNLYGVRCTKQPVRFRATTSPAQRRAPYQPSNALPPPP